jgi:hypothetical protein
MSYPIGLQILRAKVRGLQAAGATFALHISKSEKERKNHFWNEKRKLGLHCRYHLVAYGLLRGIPYEQIEKCAPENKLNPKLLFEIIKSHATWQQLTYAPQLDLERVKLLLTPAIVDASPVAASDPSLKATEGLPRIPSHGQILQSTSPQPEGLLAKARRLLEKRV